MATNIIMPQLGLTMTEGTVVKWFKAVGESVAKGEVLVEITTDKIGGQIEAPREGLLLSIACQEGCSAPVTSVIGVIGQPGEAEQSQLQVEQAAAGAPVCSQGTECQPLCSGPVQSGIKASPAAKKLARQHQVDLTLVTATGPAGRIVERDVQRYVEHVQTKPKASPLAVKLAAEQGIDLASLQKPDRIMSADVLAAAQAQPSPDGVTHPLSGMRKVIAERMSLSWHTAPHVTLTMAVDMAAINQLRQQLAQAPDEKYSFTDILVKCTAMALKEYPVMTASLVGNDIKMAAGVHIGIAVALDDGLIVPVIRYADRLGFSAIHRQIRDLSSRARQGGLLPDEISGGVFTITNLGMFGVDWFTPVINPPESAILGICRIQEMPVAVDGQVLVRPMMNLCLSFDHRLIDGAVAAKFLARLKALLENPLLLLN